MSTQIIGLGKHALAIQHIATLKVDAVPAPVDHVIVIDISGSMYGDLPELRLQLKNKLASLVKESDTVSILWFSGRGQYGVLVEQLPIHTLQDMSSLHAAIDRYLQPQGLTGFKEPLEEAIAVVDRIARKRTDSVASLFFMTDGYDNQWSDRDILEVCRKLEPKLANAVIVEFGWHCNRPLLTQMAETLGGKLIFSRDLQEYRVTFEKELGGVVGGKKVPVALSQPVELGFALAILGDDLLTFVPDARNVVMVPEGVGTVAYFTSSRGAPFVHGVDNSPLLWASLTALSQRMASDAIFEVLSALGDVALVEAFSSCFSKEDYAYFQNRAMLSALNPAKRYAAGYDPHAVPKEDAYTVLELLSDLSSSEENLFYLHHEAFAYERIGAGSQQKDASVRLEYADKSQGYPVNGVVWNEDRPNVSVRVRMEGSVALPEARPAALPAKVDSFVYRNYTIVRDGIVHTRQLPVSLSRDTFEKLQANGLLAGESWSPGQVYVLRYPRVPVINRKMVKGVTAKDTFSKVLQLQLLKGAQKVFNEFRDRVVPKESKKFLLLYGKEATDYLASLGVTDYNGFNPPSTSVKTGDFYMARELKIAVKGLSSLAKVTDVEAALAAGKKLKPSEFVMQAALQKVLAFMASPVYKDAADPASLFGTWIEAEAKAITVAARVLTQELAQHKFSIVVGHTWFKDMPSLEDNSLELPLPGYGPIAVTASLKDSQIEK